MNTPQRYRGIIASSHIDSHNDMLTKEALVKMVTAINCTDKMVRLGVDHRRDFPPRGRLENAELLEKDGDYYVLADFVEYEKTEMVDWNENLLTQYFETPFQFAEVEQEETLETTISVDPNNFSSFDEVKSFTDNLKKLQEVEFKLNLHGRKAAIPDPEIVFKLANTVLLYHLLKPAAKKFGEKIAENIADKTFEETKKVTQFITTTLKEVFYRCIPKARPVTVVFDFPGKPHIELISRTRDEKLILKGLRENKLSDVRKEIESLNEYVNIAKVQFLLSPNGNWQFNYLITDVGQTIGKKISFNKRDKRLNMMTSKEQNGS